MIATPAALRRPTRGPSTTSSGCSRGQSGLDAGGARFPFLLRRGSAASTRPPTFLRFNRALRARVDVYRNDFTGSPDRAGRILPRPCGTTRLRGLHGLRHRPRATSPTRTRWIRSRERIWKKPLIGDRGATAGGRRHARPAVPGQDRAAYRHQRRRSDLGPGLDPLSDAPTRRCRIIKNEELILLRAEASIGAGGPRRRRCRTPTSCARSRAACPHSQASTSPEAALDEVLYNKVYSLMFEGAHRWIDARHYGRLGTLPIDRPSPGLAA